ncbi:ATPase, T2SS/T4P/T4SS family [Paraburkholderia rhizosphaerae]|uniref:Twitching motility protein PilT n=1 Tax=Paraburkholderia rhizosphaerae TaxID=480658 RepID=A0A4R8LKX5_9BURK|nr:ATPase, T2SS/T4P/T4SS family [Paraburkholderia rhizosphaerae]TDY45182.1 twitching motility protein PilT [Paraburkholderia rhizosphaerae]
MTDETNMLHQLDFSYLYLGHARIGDRFINAPGTAVHPLPGHPQLQGELHRLKDACRRAWRGATDFKVDCEGASYRVSTMDTVDGEVFVLRRLHNKVASLAELGVPPAYIRQLMRRDLSGLVIVCGAPKAGKTATASAFVRERLVAHGGIALTAEDPIELPLEGRHGDGVCYQTVPGTDRVAALRATLCLGARMVYVGALDDAPLALEMLQAALDGHLLITTMRADDIGRAVTRLHALGTRVLDAASMQGLIADGLAGVLHQRLVPGAGAGPRKLETQLFMLRDAQSARNHVRHGRYDELATEIRQQMMSMIHSNALAERMGATR